MKTNERSKHAVSIKSNNGLTKVGFFELPADNEVLEKLQNSDLKNPDAFVAAWRQGAAIKLAAKIRKKFENRKPDTNEMIEQVLELAQSHPDLSKQQLMDRANEKLSEALDPDSYDSDYDWTHDIVSLYI